MKLVNALGKIVSEIFRLQQQPSWVRLIFKLYIFVAILAPVLANEEPIFMVQNGSVSFPIFQKDPYLSIDIDGKDVKVLRSTIDWRTIQADFKIIAPIPYNPGASDLSNFNYVSPFEKQVINSRSDDTISEPLPWRYRHWLGTTKTGADVLSGLIHATRLSLLVGLLSMAIATIIGICMGALAGFFGDSKLKVSRKSLVISALIFVPCWYYIFIYPEQNIDLKSAGVISIPNYFMFLKIILFLFLLLLPFLLIKNQTGQALLHKKISIPLDTLISRFIEIFLSVPRLILIITLAAISRPSLISLVVILGLCSWTGIARMTRAEFIRLRESGFYESTSALGFSTTRKILFHLLPNAFIPVRVGIIFGIAGAILAEAGLSFLGIGLAPETVSWGTLLAAGREHFSAWWLVLFPGLAISILLIILNRLGDEKRQIAIEKVL